MGYSGTPGYSLLESLPRKMFRLAVVACCLALAAAEADPYYGSYGHSLGYSGYGGYAGYGGYGGYGVKTVAAHQPYGYAASGHYIADSIGARHIAKREAEADAYYGSYGYGGLGAYGYGGYGAGYGAVLATDTPALAGAYAAPATSASIAVRGYGTPATVGAYQPYGYAASGHYRADSVGAVHIAKRSADPFYGHGYGHGYGYGYAGPVATGVSTVPHAGFPLQGYAQGYGYGHGYGY